MSTLHADELKTLSNGVVVKTKWSYVHKNGHSAWDGFKWVARYYIEIPSSRTYACCGKRSALQLAKKGLQLDALVDSCAGLGRVEVYLAFEDAGFDPHSKELSSFVNAAVTNKKRG